MGKSTWRLPFPRDLNVHEGEGDDPSDLRQDGEDEGDLEEPDQADALGEAAHPAQQAGEEQGEAQGDHRVGEDLGSERSWKRIWGKSRDPDGTFKLASDLPLNT